MCIVLCSIALLSYHPQDVGFFHGMSQEPVHNAVGYVGAYVADFFLNTIGYMIYVVLAWYSLWVLYYDRDAKSTTGECLRFCGILCVAIAPLMALYIPVTEGMPYGPGGMLGAYVGWHMLHALGHVGSVMLCALVMLSGVMRMYKPLEHMQITPAFPQAVKKVIRERPTKKLLDQWLDTTEDTPVVQQTIRAKKMDATSPLPVTTTHGYNVPLDLLNAVKDTPVARLSDADQLQMRQLVQEKLSDFGIECQVMDIIQGPVITRLELMLAAGTKASRLTTIARDLARSMSVSSVRVVEVIPGKTYVGIELPNPIRHTVFLRELLHLTHKKHGSPLTLVLGKDIAGLPVTVDLMKMPHLLVAGTTGSGKSVGINTMILSMLFQSSPQQVKLILIDPKMLELAVYGDIPHLLTPVVTDMNDAAAALRWSVVEMERRYKIMAALGVRNIQGYNEKIEKLKASGGSLQSACISDDYLEVLASVECVTLPYLVIIADEFADMMMVVGKKVEQLIARLAQKARAAGIHLILATQRPSVDVITGLIKANIPTRIAFQVSSKIDSRTILDQQGAEALLGQGDMLYMPPGSGLPIRIHGAFVSDDEVHNIVKYIKTLGKPEYLILGDTQDVQEGGDVRQGSDKDALYDEALAFVRQAKRVSISSVQRRFRIGYNRAASLIEAMEHAGAISGADESGQRRVVET